MIVPNFATAHDGSRTCGEILKANSRESLRLIEIRAASIEQANVKFERQHEMEHAWDLARAGDETRAAQILANISQRISREEITRVYAEVFGTHGAFKATLASGASILVKPYANDWYSNIAKEVGVSVLDELIGTYVVPTARHRVLADGRLASVHYFSSLHRQGSEHIVPSAEVEFLKNLVGYIHYEARADNLIEIDYSLVSQNLLSPKIVGLIDLGSAFLSGRFDLPNSRNIESMMIRESTYRKMKNLNFSKFSRALEMYFPSEVILALWHRISWLVKAYSFWNYSTGTLNRDGFAGFVDDYYAHHKVMETYIRQNWRWEDVEGAPEEIKKMRTAR